MPSSLFIGMDVGGTSTRLLARTSENPARIEREGPGANPQRVGVEVAADHLAQVILNAAAYAKATPAVVVAGIAGAGRPEDQQALTEALIGALGTPSPPAIHITHDAALTLDAAFGTAPGIVVVAGTGSVVLGRTATGDPVRAGGWGYLLGDEGSGYALGLEGLRAVCQVFDGGPETTLSALVRQHHGIASPHDLIEAVYSSDWPVQDVARLVLKAADAGDPVATHLLHQQTHMLAQQAVLVAEKVELSEPSVILWGGLTRAATYCTSLSDALLDVLPDARISALSRTPVEEALQQAVALGHASRGTV